MSKPQVKIIGNNGQLSLGKQFAGKMVLVNQVDEGTWFIKAGTFIPDSENWLYRNGNETKVDKALEWAENNKAKDNFDEQLKRMQSEKK